MIKQTKFHIILNMSRLMKKGLPRLVLFNDADTTGLGDIVLPLKLLRGRTYALQT